jgi:subtilisin family serine protease
LEGETVHKAIITVLAVCVSLLATVATAGTIAPALQEQLATAAADQPVSVIVHLTHQAPILGISQDLTARKATRKQRHEEIVFALKDAARSQESLATELQSATAGGDVIGFTSYWIANLMVVQAVPAEIERIAARSDVAHVELNFVPELIEPVESYPARTGDGMETDTRGIGFTPGLEAIRVREVWEILGIDGAGALIGSLDTGVDGNHPALNARWRGNHAAWNECWLDVLGTSTQFPNDGNSHGTHTTGTMTGLAFDDTIGVAPGAEWIACNTIAQDANPGFDNDVIESFQWFTDPDGDPFTVEDVPDVVQNSWGVHEGFTGYDDCDDRWWAVIDNCEAAGVVVTWSAGNEGTDGLRSPADRATTFYNCFSVGSTIHSPPYTISSFSSRGPSTCSDIINPDLAIKPEVSAPGSDIYSALPGGSYGYKSGTSMSGPHVAGVVALIRSVAPDMDVDLVKQILIETCVDLGNPGEDNTYGHGFIDAYEAVLAAMSGFGTVQGNVTNASFGDLPLAGARVELPERGTVWTVAADGTYSGMVPEGTYLAIGSREGFESQEVTIEVLEDGLTVQDFQLTDIAGPEITEIDGPVATSDTAGPYLISARVNDPSTVSDVTLYWRIAEGAWQTLQMSGAGDLYSAGIPGQPAHTSIAYYIQAADGVDLTSTAPEDAPASFFELVITESLYATEAEDPGDPAWTLGIAGDTASSGYWLRAEPVGTTYHEAPMQTDDDHTPDPGVACYVTANGPVGGAPGDHDVDDGCTTLLSPVFNLSTAPRAFVTYWRWFGQDGFTADDDWVVEATNNGTTWVELERISNNHNAWNRVGVELGSLGGDFELTDRVQLRFLACDLGGGGLVEAAIDDFELGIFMDEISSVDDVTVGPRVVLLRQNQPNPFNPATTITFSLPRDAEVDLAVFGVDGRRVATLAGDLMSAGEHTVTWRGRDESGRRVASGAYFYRLIADGQLQVKRMVMVK